MTWANDIVRALENLGGQAELAQIYAEIETIRPSLTKAWKSSVRECIQRRSSDSNAYKESNPDLFYSLEGLGQGVWGLRNYLNSTPKASDLSDLGDDAPSVVKQDTYRILRDTTLARKLKKLHEDTCQLCSTQVKLRADTTYSEAHHIIPLGQPHFGPDTAENMIVLCPNCHVLCDYGAIELSLNTISMRAAHSVSSESVTYHNKSIWGGDL